MPDPIAALTDALRDRYLVERELGRGGMATVYLARDLKHGREVAIKVLRPDLSASLGAERFLKEIEIAARLTHPHILPLYDSGGVEGFLYYVMPYIDGGSLRQRMVDQRRLGLEEALRTATPVSDALSYAHRMGIFHRDIKPENILFSQSHPMVADFGIAKAISTAGATNLTRTGFPLGTPGYMSPEQAAGLTDLDERTDVYSLAATFYEMIVGEVPGRWPTEDSVAAGRFLDAPAGHRSRLAEAGSRVEAALVRGLAVRHDQRTATPIALMEDLRGKSTPPTIRRRYSESEVEEIVRRASEIEARAETGAMTIGGVEALAREVGIAPDHVRAAAQSVRAGGNALERSSAGAALATTGAGRKNPWVGSPTSIYLERVVDGEVPEAEFQAMVDEIRRVLSQPGIVSQLGRSFSWTANRGGQGRRDVEVAVSVRAGKTRISIRENLNTQIGGIFGGIGGGLGGGGMGPVIGVVSVNHLPVLAFAAIIPLWLATVYGIARTVYGRVYKSKNRDLTMLADRLVIVAEELVR